MKDIKVAVAGTGYVGLSIATLLSQHHKVTAVDVIADKVEKINARISPIQDEYIEKYFAEKELDLQATLDGESAYRDADFVVIAAPTNYDSKKNFFDTSHVEEVIDLVLKVNPDAVMVIKSTVPVGYTASVREKFSYRERLADGTMKVVVPKIIFAPEFLRESKALHELTVEGGLEACQLLPETECYGACARQVYVEGVACAHGGVIDLAHGVGV